MYSIFRHQCTRLAAYAVALTKSALRDASAYRQSLLLLATTFALLTII